MLKLFNRLIIGQLVAAIFIFATVQASSQSAPVLVFSRSLDHENEVVVGHTIGSSSFLNKLEPLLKSKVQVLSVGQLLDQDLRGELSSLKGSKLVNYYPSVHTPYAALTQKLDSANTEYLEYPDAATAVAQFNARMTDPATETLILTGTNLQSHHRHRRQANSPAVTNGNATIYVGGETCAALFESIFILDQTKGPSGTNVIELDIDSSASVTSMTCSSDSAVLNIGFKNSSETTLNIKSATLNFRANSRYWTYSSGSITYQDGKTNVLTYMGLPYGMETPFGFSFACTKTVFLLTNNDTTGSQTKINFYIDYFQLQAFNTTQNKTADDIIYTFGTVNYCQGFFSNGIWMAISASAILITILIIGVSLLVQVNTMDRFDDPKGKQLTIAIEK